MSIAHQAADASVPLTDPLADQPLEIDEEIMAEVSPIRPTIREIMQPGGWEILHKEDIPTGAQRRKIELEYLDRSPVEDGMIKTIIELPFEKKGQIPAWYCRSAGDMWKMMQRDFLPRSIVDRMQERYHSDVEQIQQIVGSYYDPMAMAREMHCASAIPKILEVEDRKKGDCKREMRNPPQGFGG